VLGNPRIRVAADRHQEQVSLAPFQRANQRTAFIPNHVAVETTEGAVVAERASPRAAFAGHTLETQWDDLHFIYFASYAMWTYLTVPFCLTPGRLRRRRNRAMAGACGAAAAVTMAPRRGRAVTP
jgi:hypothetical protein